ncbi:methyl-accepting chemotaxis protein [Bacillaceae bacterium S4-13-58]
MDKTLQSFVTVAPYINELTSSDFAISVTDLEKCICYIPGKKINHRIEEGTPHVKSSLTYQCTKEKRKMMKQIDKEVFGFPYISIAMPIFNSNHEIVGAVSFNESVDRQNTLFEIANSLHDAMEQLTQSTNTISESMNEVMLLGDQLKMIEEDSKAKVEETNKVVHFISHVSSQSNLLGLNAAIEAARVGEQGKGFGVVAKEVRKLAATTEDYVKKVTEILNELKLSTQQMNEKIDEMVQSSSVQASSIQEVHSFTEEVFAMVDHLRQQSQLLSSEE